MEKQFEELEMKWIMPQACKLASKQIAISL